MVARVNGKLDLLGLDFSGQVGEDGRLHVHNGLEFQRSTGIIGGEERGQEREREGGAVIRGRHGNWTYGLVVQPDERLPASLLLF